MLLMGLPIHKMNFDEVPESVLHSLGWQRHGTEGSSSSHLRNAVLCGPDADKELAWTLV